MHNLYFTIDFEYFSHLYVEFNDFYIDFEEKRIYIVSDSMGHHKQELEFEFNFAKPYEKTLKVLLKEKKDYSTSC